MWLEAASDLAEYDVGRQRRVFETLAKVLPPGVPVRDRRARTAGLSTRTPPRWRAAPNGDRIKDPTSEDRNAAMTNTIHLGTSTEVYQPYHGARQAAKGEHICSKCIGPGDLIDILDITLYVDKVEPYTHPGIVPAGETWAITSDRPPNEFRGITSCSYSTTISTGTFPRVAREYGQERCVASSNFLPASPPR